MAIEALSGWTKEQKSVVAASYLGWMLDAFDFFLMVFVFRDIAKEFNTGIPAVAFATVLTLAVRPIGAFIFGRVADRYGRRPALMADILLYSVLAFASAFSPNLFTLLIVRGLFGIAMGGEWGVGASLAMESIPPKARGLVSGILQAGYPSGYLFASLAYFFLYPVIGWRGMLMLGIVPALITFFIRRHVKESPSWRPKTQVANEAIPMLTAYARLVVYAALLMLAVWLFANRIEGVSETPNTVAAALGDLLTMPRISILCLIVTFGIAFWLALKRPDHWIEFFAAMAMVLLDYFALVVPAIPISIAIIYNVAAILAGEFLKRDWRLGIYAVLLMTAFNFFSHGTQDLYPTFLQVQHGFDSRTVGFILVIFNLGAVLGSLTFGTLSERIGRRRAIVIAALGALPIIPLWVFGGNWMWFAVGSFLMQFMVQSAWGIVPVHLNELSPPSLRGTFPGFVYQLGNLLASVNATLQSQYAASHGDDYASALGIVAIGAALTIAVLVGFGIEKKGIAMDADGESPATAG